MPDFQSKAFLLLLFIAIVMLFGLAMWVGNAFTTNVQTLVHTAPEVVETVRSEGDVDIRDSCERSGGEYIGCPLNPPPNAGVCIPCGCPEGSRWSPVNYRCTIDTSSWKTYRNEEYGFEVKYPNNWTYDDKDGCGKNCIGFSDGKSQDWNAAILVHVDSSYSQVKKEKIIGLLNPRLEFKIQEENFILNGISWTKVTVREENGPATPLGESYLTEYRGNTVNVYQSYEILSTFKFIE